MAHIEWTEADSARAKQIWTAYQQEHDLSDCTGKTAGIDPHSERIWLGDSIRDVVLQRDAEGLDSPLFFERIGSDSYLRKGEYLSGRIPV